MKNLEKQFTQGIKKVPLKVISLGGNEFSPNKGPSSLGRRTPSPKRNELSLGKTQVP